MPRATYANVMATLAVVLALAAGGGHAIADATSAAATSVKRALKIGKQAKKSAKRANAAARAAAAAAAAADAKATAAGGAAAAADAKAQQALAQKAPDADLLDGLDAGAFPRAVGRTWALTAPAERELATDGVTVYVDCMDLGYEAEARVTNTSGEAQRVVTTLLRFGDEAERTSGGSLAPGDSKSELLLVGSPDGAHAGERVLFTLMPADGTGPATRVEVVGTLRSPDAGCVLDAQVLRTAS